MTFTLDEINLLCIYDTADKAELERQLRLSVPHIENTELKEIAESALSKLTSLTAAEFAELELAPSVYADDLEG